MGPDGLVKNLVKKEPFRRILIGVSAGPFTPGFKFEPSRFLKNLLPAAVKPPSGFFSFAVFCSIGTQFGTNLPFFFFIPTCT